MKNIDRETRYYSSIAAAIQDIADIADINYDEAEKVFFWFNFEVVDAGTISVNIPVLAEIFHDEVSKALSVPETKSKKLFMTIEKKTSTGWKEIFYDEYTERGQNFTDFEIKNYVERFSFESNFSYRFTIDDEYCTILDEIFLDVSTHNKQYDRYTMYRAESFTKEKTFFLNLETKTVDEPDRKEKEMKSFFDSVYSKDIAEILLDAWKVFNS
jgi:hypothetical protein